MSIPTVFSGTMGCGHEDSVSLEKVPLAKRWSYSKFLAERGRCKACAKKDTVRAHEKAASEARGWAQAQGLPELGGTPKQQTFAEQVRRDLISDAWEVLVADGGMSEEQFEEKILQRAQLVTDPSVWLDSRESDPLELEAVLEGSAEVRARVWERATGARMLQGTQRQVAWARLIRFEKVVGARAALVPSSMSDGEFSGTIEVEAARINSARWWLDINDAPVDVLAELMRSAGNDAYVDNVEGE